MDAEDRLVEVRFQVPRDGLVRRQHELFDDAVGELPLAAPDARHRTLLVEHDQRLRQVEVDRAALVPPPVEDLASSFISSKRSTSAA